MLRIGIIGTGIRGKLHARSLGFVEGVELVAAADPSPAARERAQKELGIPVYESHSDLISRHELDAVIISTPDFAHLQPAVDAAQAGLHMLIEKPLAMNSQDAENIRDAVNRAGVQCMVAFENRWNLAFQPIHEAAKSGALGEVLSQTATLSNTYFVPTQMLPWAGRSSPGWFLMAHTVDLALWLSGKTPARVYASGFKKELIKRGIDTWDAVHALLTFEDGTTASFESLWILPESTPSVVDFKYRIVGSKSSFYTDLHEKMIRHAGDGFSFPNALVQDVDGRPQGFPVWMVQSFARKLMSGEDLTPTVEDGLRVTRIIEAIHTSLVEGTPQQL